MRERAHKAYCIAHSVVSWRDYCDAGGRLYCKNEDEIEEEPIGRLKRRLLLLDFTPIELQGHYFKL